MEAKRVKTIIDVRERDIIKAMNPPFETKQLDLGDIIFVDEESDNPLLIIERKTVSDLAASIKDGRAREQKARLIDLYVKKGIKVMYLIESFDSPKSGKTGLPHNTLLSSLINTIVRDNIMVYHTSGVEMSTKVIAKLSEKINEHYNKGLYGNQETDYTSKLKLKKKENKKVEDSIIFLLCQVPKVSVTVAEAIRKEYPTLMSLCKAYMEKETEKEKELLLANMMLNEKRKVGKVISTNVYHYLN